MLAEPRADAHDDDSVGVVLSVREHEDVPVLTMMTLWEWRSPRETTKNLTRPEVARYLIRMTMELANLLGISLEEAQHG